MIVVDVSLESIQGLYSQGLYLRAYRESEPLGPLAEWPGAEGRVLAGRLAGVLGAQRMARSLHSRAFREWPEDPRAAYYFVWARLHRRGPWKALQTWREIGELPQAPSDLRADWFSLRGYLHGSLRDFHAADAAWRTACAIGLESAWRLSERAFVLQIQDRYQEAYELAEAALELRPFFRPAVQTAAHVLQLLQRERDAMNLLEAAAERLESGDVLLELAAVQNEMGRHAAARATYERALEYLPLREKLFEQAISARRSDAAYLAGDEPEAISLARAAHPGFYQQVADNLAAAKPADKRILLPVGFVRQHHLTCAPATLTALCGYWNRPAEHLQVAEKICYDGTPAHSERNWAVQNGFYAREFTVDWATATGLIDRGLPFTLTTVEATSAHLQSVVGYDARRGTLLIRDPTLPKMTELLAEKGLEHYRASGPRGMLLLPHEELGRLAGIDLPDAELYDLLHTLQLSLDKHDRAAAASAQDELERLAPEHRLTLQGRRTLAAYDCDLATQLTLAEKLLALYPKDENLLRIKLELLRAQAAREPRLALLAEICAKQAVSPVFELQYAEELCEDGRAHQEARARLRRLFKMAPYDPRCYHALAGLLWNERKFEEATDLYRVAACLDDKQERYARSYFSASRHARRTSEALELLSDRVERAGTKSSWPAQTLHGAFMALDRSAEAEKVLEAALARRPQDASLLLFAAEACLRCGRLERAAEFITRAEGVSHRGEWLRSLAGLHAARGELPEALSAWRQVLEIEPQAVDAVGSVARLVAQTTGSEAVIEFLRGVTARFPHNVPLLQLAVEWFEDEHLPEAEEMLRRGLSLNPADAWAHRELAGLLSQQMRHEEALLEAEAALALEPWFTYCHSVLGRAHELAGRLPEARAAYRRAVELSADNAYAIGALIRCVGSHAGRKGELDFVFEQLAAQTTFGEGLLEFREQARTVLGPEELLARLQQGWQARPDLWHAWSAVIRQLVELDRAEEACRLAAEAAERFPLLPGAWLDLANARRADGDESGEIAALEQARALNPNWSMPVRLLADVYLRQGNLAAYRDVARLATERMPLDAVLFGYLADGLWRLEDREGALAALERAVKLDPGYGWAWDSLRAWSAEIGRPELAVAAARDLVQRRPAETRSWLCLAKTLTAPEDLEERLAAVERALALFPRSLDAALLKSRLLAEAERFDEAEAACDAAVWNGEPPYPLRGQMAWLLACRGDLAGAMDAMQRVLEENPDYYWAWEQVAEWSDRLGNLTERRRAAEALVRLEPGNADAWGTYAEACLANADRSGAKAAFARAFDIAPDYQYPGARLFDLQLEDGELSEAEETLQRLKRYLDAYVLGREARLAAKTGNQAQAASALQAIAREGCPSNWPLSAAVEAMREAGWHAAAEAELHVAIAAPEAHPQVLAEWVVIRGQNEGWQRAAADLSELAAESEPWFEAASRLLSRLGQVQEPRVGLEFFNRHRSLLGQNSHAWGAAGYRLYCAGRYQQTIEWLADWRSRPDLEQWMLSNLADACFALGRLDQMVEVRRHALTLTPDTTDGEHRAGLALAAAIQGRWAEIEPLVAACDSPDLPPDFARQRALAAECAAIRAACAAGQAPFSYHEAVARLSRAADWRNSRFLYRSYLQCLLRLCRECSGALFVPWIRFKLLWHRLNGG